MSITNDGTAIIDIAYDGPFQIPLSSSSIINISITLPTSEIVINPVLQTIEYDTQLQGNEEALS